MDEKEAISNNGSATHYLKTSTVDYLFTGFITKNPWCFFFCFFSSLVSVCIFDVFSCDTWIYSTWASRFSAWKRAHQRANLIPLIIKFLWPYTWYVRKIPLFVMHPNLIFSFSFRAFTWASAKEKKKQIEYPKSNGEKKMNRKTECKHKSNANK